MKRYYMAALAGLLLTASCRNQENNQATTSTTTPETTTATASRPAAPDWAKNATIYEVNVRQFSEAGTLKAVEQQLPRLKELGVDIVWLMPIYPISQTKKKGALGSPYAVSDYQAVNPEFGTMADLKALVRRAHDLGLRVILDWVPNHTGWDHPWIKQFPDWYTQKDGKIISAVDNEGKPTGWDDTADLNYNSPDMRRAMINSMAFWVREADIDGFRCDVSGLVPLDFWAEVRPALNKLKVLFMLSEWEDDPRQFEVCFNANYGWSMHKLLKDVAKGKRPATAIDSLLTVNRRRFPDGYYQMHFTQNHDENTWNGTLAESFGPGADAFVVLTSTLEGMPLVYNGMESGLSKRLEFFEKDPIYWGNYGKSDFFKTLLTLKHRNRALWNGKAGGEAVKIQTGHDDKVYAFYRQKENDRVAVLLNLSGQPQEFRLLGQGFEGVYTDVFSRQSTELKPDMTVSLKPWEYRVLTN